MTDLRPVDEWGDYSTLGLPFMDGSERCAEIGSDAFFPEKGEHSSDAKRICRECPLLDPCRDYAIDNPQYGVWGATTERERRGLKRQRRIAS